MSSFASGQPKRQVYLPPSATCKRRDVQSPLQMTDNKSGTFWVTKLIDDKVTCVTEDVADTSRDTFGKMFMAAYKVAIIYGRSTGKERPKALIERIISGF